MMNSEEIEFWRERGFSYLGTDRECWYFQRNGFAYFHHEDIRGGAVLPVATFASDYSVARHEFGADHARIEEAFLDFHYQELADYLYPNQVKAWTLPVQQEAF